MMTSGVTLFSGSKVMFNHIRQWSKDRPDTEHVAIMFRFGIMAVLFALLYTGQGFENALVVNFYSGIKQAMFVYVGLLVVEFTHMLSFKGISASRRVLAIFNDHWLLAYAAYLLGPQGSGLYPFYYWIILAAGFRYGTVYLMLSGFLSVISLFGLFSYFDMWATSPITTLVQIGGIIVLSIAIASFLRKIQSAIDGEKAANRAKSTFLATISHEVRTPLNAIKGLSDLLLDGKLSAEQHRMATTISESGTSLLQLINHLLDYSRAESGKMPVCNEDFDLFASLGKVYRLLDTQAKAKGLVLNVHMDPKLRRLFHGNRRFLEDIFINLLGNAIKFTETGHVTLLISVLESSSSKQKLRFDVIDTGIGILADAQDRIFDSFTQSDDQVMTRFGGSGLGLALCKEYVHAMDGSISVRSNRGEGSCFTVELTMSLRLHNPEKIGQISDQGDGLKLVAVTSDAALGQSLKSAHKYSVICSDIHQAVAALAQGNDVGNAVSLLMLDRACLPDDCSDVAERIETLSKTSEIHVAWICKDRETPEKQMRSRPQDGLIYVSRHEVASRLCKIARLAANLHTKTENLTIAGVANQQESKHILVADDNRTNQMVIEKMLESLGHTVICVDRGDLALDQLASKDFDLVFLDINMPVMSGLETARQFAKLSRRWPESKKSPMIALTADASPEMEQHCLQAGMVACLHKPIDRARLGALIDKYADREDKDMDILSAQDQSHRNTILAEETLQDLRSLGGDEFVAALAKQFSEDGIAALKRLHLTVTECDDGGFRDEAHALRSAAANIGAHAVFKLCLSWRDMTAAELHEEGTSHVLELASTMAESITALEHHLDIALPQLNGFNPELRSESDDIWAI